MESGSEIKLSELQCADWKIQRKRRRDNPKDEETANSTREEEIDRVKNPDDNNRDSIQQISTDDGTDSEATISTGKPTEESEKRSFHVYNAQDDDNDSEATITAGKSREKSEKSPSTDEVVSSSNPRKMLDFDLNELPPLEDEEDTS